MPGYTLMAAPTLYPGQIVRAELEASPENPAPLEVRFLLRAYNAGDRLADFPGPSAKLHPGQRTLLEWRIPALDGPAAEVGVTLAGETGKLYLDWLGWTGEPELASPPQKAAPGSQAWRKAWVNGVEEWSPWGAAFNLIQNEGRGLLITGTREWKDIRVSSTLTPTLLQAGGIAVRTQGMRRFYALLLCADQKVRLVKALEGDRVLGEASFAWEHMQPVDLSLEARRNRLRAWVNGRLVFDLEDRSSPLLEGGAAFVVEEGHLMADAITISPAEIRLPAQS